MTEPIPPDLHRLLQEGGPEATNRLIPLVYEELRALASHFLRREGPGHTLQTTALAHEAYLRLVNQEKADWKDKAHFLAIAAKMIRRILVDHGRRRRSSKRGGEMQRVSLAEGAVLSDGSDPVDALALDEALRKLEALDSRQGQVVELRFFGGLEVEQVAELLEISPRTVAYDWDMARAFLKRELEGSRK